MKMLIKADKEGGHSKVWNYSYCMILPESYLKHVCAHIKEKQTHQSIGCVHLHMKNKVLKRLFFLLQCLFSCSDQGVLHFQGRTEAYRSENWNQKKSRLSWCSFSKWETNQAGADQHSCTDRPQLVQVPEVSNLQLVGHVNPKTDTNIRSLPRILWGVLVFY